ncbi:hypothetical protein HK100_011227, partial [Physocladia obscura]
MQRINAHTASPYEPIVGYARAVRKGPFVYISGTTSTDPETGVFEHANDAGAQATKIFDNIRRALESVGATVGDVVRTRMFVKNIVRDSDAVGRAHFAAFGKVEPVATMVEVAGFIDERMLVEIEVDAVV